jgi:hypothetical protein
MTTLVETMIELQRRAMSVSVKPFCDWQLEVVPGTDDEDLVDTLESHFTDLREFLPGVCDSCGFWAMKRTIAYWAARPYLCLVCLDQIVDYLNETDQWPRTHVPETYEALTD